MTAWMNLGQQLKMNASKYPDTLALVDKDRKFTYPETNKRVNKLGHSLLSLGLDKGDKVAVFMENSIEIVEIFLATAKTGLVIVPINFRLVGQEVSYIVNNSDAKAFIVHDEFTPMLDGIKDDLKGIAPDNYIVVGEDRHGYQTYEPFIERSAHHEPQCHAGGVGQRAQNRMLRRERLGPAQYYAVDHYERHVGAERLAYDREIGLEEIVGNRDKRCDDDRVCGDTDLVRDGLLRHGDDHTR